MPPRPSSPRKTCVLLILSWFALFATRLTAQTTPEWPCSTPEEQGVDSARLVRLLMRIQSEHLRIDDFLVVRHGTLVSELYSYPNTRDNKHILYSATKSFSSSLIGIAINRGLIKGVDEKVVDLLKTSNTVHADPKASQMTLRHLLTMSTGHSVDTYNLLYSATDWVKAFLEAPLPNTPGAPFLYNSGASCMLIYALEARAEVPASRFAEEQLLTPLGITNYTWENSPQGVPIGGWGLYLRARDFARFGQMYLNRGRWNGRQIVPEAWVAACSKAQVSTGTGGHWGSGYSYQFWINHFGGYRADGAYGQFAYILPEKDAVIIFNSPTGADNNVPPALMESAVLPALGDGSRLPGNPVANALLQQHLARLAQGPLPANAAPLFLASPTDQTLSDGAGVHLVCGLENAAGASYQWYHEGTPLAGATAAQLDLAQVAQRDSGLYWVQASNAGGTTRSLPFTIKVQAPPRLVSEPEPLLCAPGSTALFQVRAQGSGLTYSWFHDGTPVPGATGPSLTIPACSTADNGTYSVTVSNEQGSLSTPPVRLDLASADERARLVNLSARAHTGTGSDTFTIGFNLSPGTARTTLPVILRCAGPSLAAFNVSAPLAAPSLSLYRDQTLLQYRQEPSVDPSLTTLSTIAGAFDLGFPQGDQACLHSIYPGANTLQMNSGLPGVEGIALGECYEAPGAAVVGGARLSNLSARATVTPGEGTLEAGFVITGTGSLKILIRGIGPTLASFGIKTPLKTPRLELFRDGKRIADNQGWAGSSALKAAFAQTGAFSLPEDSKDSALLLTLEAGVYTAHISDPNQPSGTALIEIYEAP